MGRALPWVAVVALLLAAWSAWRVHALSEESSARGQAPPEPASAPPLASSVDTRDGAQRPSPLAAAPPAETDDAAWRRTIESRLDALTKRFDASAADTAALAGYLEELTRARMGANERVALATARQGIASQSQFQQGARIDEDADGTGEYGGFVEMAGGVVRRRGHVQASPHGRLVPAVLHNTWQTLNAHGEGTRSGYLYRIYLPGSGGVGVGEPTEGFPADSVATDLAETTWCMYAWPEKYGTTGTRTYFTNQGGDVLWTDASAYSGPGAGPAPDAAYLPEVRGRIVGRAAIGLKGVDGNVWQPPED